MKRITHMCIIMDNSLVEESKFSVFVFLFLQEINLVENGNDVLYKYINNFYKTK